MKNKPHASASIAALALAGAALMSSALTTSAMAAEGFRAGDWLVRGRVISVTPDESSTITVINGTAHADNNIVPEVDFSYFITDNFSLELIAAVTKHNMDARGTSLGRVDLGSVWLLPPTLTIQYHWEPTGNISPYLGVGLNYTTFFDADLPAGAVTAIKYGDGVGPAVQAGFDMWLNENWTFNADVKKIWLNTDVKINGGAINADVDLNPWVFGVGFGYRF